MATAGTADIDQLKDTLAQYEAQLHQVGKTVSVVSKIEVPAGRGSAHKRTRQR